jgi:hypothetical protein
LAQFTEGNLHYPARELRQDLLKRNGNGQGAGVRVQEPGLQFQRQPAENWLQRQFDPLAILMHAIVVRRRGFESRSYNDPTRGPISPTGLSGGVVFPGGLNQPSDELLKVAKHLDD